MASSKSQCAIKFTELPTQSVFSQKFFLQRSPGGFLGPQTNKHLPRSHAGYNKGVEYLYEAVNFMGIRLGKRLVLHLHIYPCNKIYLLAFPLRFILFIARSQLRFGLITKREDWRKLFFRRVKRGLFSGEINMWGNVGNSGGDCSDWRRLVCQKGGFWRRWRVERMLEYKKNMLLFKDFKVVFDILNWNFRN